MLSVERREYDDRTSGNLFAVRNRNSVRERELAGSIIIGNDKARTAKSLTRKGSRVGRAIKISMRHINNEHETRRDYPVFYFYYRDRIYGTRSWRESIPAAIASHFCYCPPYAVAVKAARTLCYVCVCVTKQAEFSSREGERFA